MTSNGAESMVMKTVLMSMKTVSMSMMQLIDRPGPEPM
jgi:hypothetical protein